MFLPVQATPIYPLMILESRNIPLLKKLHNKDSKLMVDMLMHKKRIYWREKKTTYYEKNENLVYIPSLKEGLNPNKGRGNSGYLTWTEYLEWEYLISQLISICIHSAKQPGNRKSNNKLY